MARYAPLPSVDIDPRNEAQLVQQASQRVYQASGQTLNDFSSGNPLAALLEGQAFAQGEFLFWANQLPQSILIEWLGPFLGAMRKLGTPSIARLQLTVPPVDTVTTVPSGTAFLTDPDLTGGEQFTFILDSDVTIPAGETTVFATASSQFVGQVYNAPANSVTGTSAININGLTATNPQPASGGSDVETYQEVQERFFTLIRRRNPVSAEDWQDFFIDFYGVGTQTSVQPNRPNQGSYNYLTDYLQPNGQVSFFVLGPDGIELNQSQLERGQNVVNFLTSIENKAHLYPITLSQVQYDLTVEVDANGSFGENLKATSLNFRDRLYSILTPGVTFPSTIDPTVSDVDAAFYSTFTNNTRFVDPHIKVSAAYNTPPLLESAAATYTNVYSFEAPGSLLNKDDLVLTTLPAPTYYPVLTSFTPYSTDKKDQTIYDNLVLQQIEFLVAGYFLRGQVCYWDPSVGGDGELHVINENITIGTQLEIPELIRTGKISTAKTYSAWTVGNTYQQTTGLGVYDPQIIQYDYSPDEFIPNPTSLIPVTKRPGTFIWVVGQNFTLLPPNNQVTTAFTDFKIGAPITPQQLEVGGTYAAGTWVYTPQIGSGPDPVADPYYNYVDITAGVWRDFPCQHEEREVPRNDLAADSHGLVAREFIVDQFGPAGMVIEVARYQRNVDVARLADGLAIVHRLQHRQEAFALLDDAGNGVEVLRALMAREFRPCSKTLARRLHRSIHIGRRSLRDSGKHLAIGRIGDVEGFRRGPGEGTVDEVAEALRVLLQPRHSVGVALRGGAVVHGVENVADAGHDDLRRGAGGRLRHSGR